MAHSLHVDSPELAFDVPAKGSWNLWSIVAVAFPVIVAVLIGLSLWGPNIFGPVEQGRNWRHTSASVWLVAALFLVGFIVSIIFIRLARKSLDRPENITQQGSVLLSVGSTVATLILAFGLVLLARFLFTVPGNFFLPPWMA